MSIIRLIRQVDYQTNFEANIIIFDYKLHEEVHFKVMKSLYYCNLTIGKSLAGHSTLDLQIDS